ncbi:hypothetical protein [Terribacillus saccharophilus]|uniref:hypothetical protein n=1 Tax=Terribacillus saccharophilus TaxID=361277 RepID=UPI00298A0123|nr:hypothetical protein [Terribacillus saccharophilus]MCM3227719.1 hypothetical protein [Terribacillus saccharophilus]
MEQLGLSLGIKEVVDVGFSITHEEYMQHIVLQDYMLAIGPIILATIMSIRIGLITYVLTTVLLVII